MPEVMHEIVPWQHWRSRGTVRQARELLGKYLVRTSGGRVDAHLITEVEAYDGENDLACHAARGRTPRTEVMYGDGGHWYVYLCYGMHEMLNLVVGPRDWPAAVLIRGLAGLAGPGRLTRALAIGRAMNGRPAEPATGLHLEDRGVVVPRRCVQASPRVGVAYAGVRWAAMPWRFTLDWTALPPPRPAPARR